jgi:hypothetical protein
MLHFTAAAFAWLSGVHVLLPWGLLAAALFLVDLGLDRSGLTQRLRDAVPFGGLAADALDRAPTVALGAAWAASTAGTPDTIALAVYGALSALAVPVLLAARKWLVGLLPLAAALLAMGCGTPADPKFTPKELECVAIEKAATGKAFAKCGDDVSGACASATIYEDERKRVYEKCLPEVK